MGLFCRGTGNSIYNESRGDRCVARHNKVREKKQRPEEEPKTGNEMKLVLGQSHSGEQ